ncbi:MAG: class I SAM-dependent methyltransferase [Tannerella sp.]|nr:class I SAM-dependent methyltransferase [Tannerella sp.]
MQMTDSLRKFIHEHADDDVLQLVLKVSHYKDIDLRFAVRQIAARRQVRDKLPSWYADDNLIFPSVLAAEQCSSERTAIYKQRLVDSDDTVLDLTGGLGVDSYFLSRKARQVTYVERNAEYCETAAYNMKQLGAHNVSIRLGDAVDLITGRETGLAVGKADPAAMLSEPLSAADVLYIDPARRGAGNKRMFAVKDCEPDLTGIWPLLREKHVKIIVKLSPMLDINQVLSQLSDVAEVHVVSVRNDCKELLVIAHDCYSSDGKKPCDVSGKSGVKIYCVNFTSSDEEQSFRFCYNEEKTAVATYAKDIARYLYEPNASILKAGAYRMISSHYGLKKLHVNSHLYTSETCMSSFAGRIFEVKNVHKFDNRLCRELSAQMARANISVRNFPLSVDELRKRTRIADGGDAYLFATTLSDGKKVLIDCRKVNAITERHKIAGVCII